MSMGMINIILYNVYSYNEHNDNFPITQSVYNATLMGLKISGCMHIHTYQAVKLDLLTHICARMYTRGGV